jgi:hypothetical protein
MVGQAWRVGAWTSGLGSASYGEARQGRRAVVICGLVLFGRARLGAAGRGLVCLVLALPAYQGSVW